MPSDALHRAVHSTLHNLVLDSYVWFEHIVQYFFQSSSKPAKFLKMERTRQPAYGQEKWNLMRACEQANHLVTTHRQSWTGICPYTEHVSKLSTELNLLQLHTILCHLDSMITNAQADTLWCAMMVMLGTHRFLLRCSNPGNIPKTAGLLAICGNTSTDTVFAEALPQVSTRIQSCL